MLELPDDLADRAAEQLMGLVGAERDRALAALVVALPEHEVALRRLAAELSGAAQLLDGAYPGPAAAAETTTHIGGHRVIRRLGEGAFGIVFLCAQERPVVRNVAIKVLRPDAGDEQTLRRFAGERQLLASLNHPSITQVFDAGEMPDGRPFFVMEYVEGPTLRRYCEERGLSCRERLQLFTALCRGVAHAHTRGIVHRDLKPGNVLVVDTETGPQPKIIDFGIAKALLVSEADTGPRTEAGRVVGTPGYMSPEQASGDARAVDGRADVFALGVMLYELLTWQLPWAHGVAATDTEPLLPSAKITTSTHSGSANPTTRRRQLQAELRGDLDWIALKALAYDRDDRYPTPVALVEDIERHLRGEPVSVGPPSVTYRLLKYVRRNRAVVASLGAGATLLVTGVLIAMSYGSAAEAEIAGAKSAVAAGLADGAAVAEGLLERANDVRLREAPQGDVARQALLEAAQSFYDRCLQDRPTDPDLRVGRCKALLSISHVHWLLGDTHRAGVAADAAAIEAEALLAAAPDNITRRALVGEALRRQGMALSLATDNLAAQPKFVAAAAQFAACAAAAPTQYGRTHASVLRNAAETLEPQRAAEAVVGLRASLAAIEALRSDHPDLTGLDDDHAQCCLVLAKTLFGLRQLETVEDLLTQVEADLPRVTQERARLTVDLRNWQSIAAWQCGDRPRSLLLMQECVAAAAAWQAEQPQRMLPQEMHARALRDLGGRLNVAGDFEQSSAVYRRSIVMVEAMVQAVPSNPRPLVGLCTALSVFARTLSDRFRRCDLAEAAACAARAIEVDDRLASSANTGRQPRWQLLALLAVIEDALGQPTLASWQRVEVELPSSVDEVVFQHHDLLIEAYTGLARAYLVAESHAVATTWVARARERIAANQPHFDKRMVEVGWIEARLAAARGELAEAAAAADRILAARSTWFGTRRAADCMHLAWRSAVAAGDAADGIYAERAAELYERVMKTLAPDVAKDANDPWFVLPWGCACVRSAELTAAAGDTPKARGLLAAALPMLEGVRAASPADQWDEGVMRDGLALQARLAAAQGR